MKDFVPGHKVAPMGADNEEAWKPAADFPELQAMFEERAQKKTKLPPPPAPAKPKASRAPLPPLVDEPNYVLRLVALLIVGGIMYGAVQAYRSSRSDAEAPAAAKAPAADAAETAPEPAQMWPEPGAPADRVEAEGKLLEAYFPVVLSAQGIKPEHIPAACASAKAFISGYDGYKSRFAAQLDDFSRRVAVTMRADNRTSALLDRLDRAGKQGMDLSSLKYPKNLRQNTSLADFSLEHALANARFLLSSVCPSQP
jgi:hypothetical protein